jgi:hypothetical protein
MTYWQTASISDSTPERINGYYRLSGSDGWAVNAILRPTLSSLSSTSSQGRSAPNSFERCTAEGELAVRPLWFVTQLLTGLLSSSPWLSVLIHRWYP